VRRILRILLRVALVLLVVPVAFVGLYRFIDPPATPLMVIRTIEGQGWRHRPVPIGSVSPALLRSVLAAEDARFCGHWGFDLAEIRAAVGDWQGGDALRGASTISQQTARNLFLWPGGGFVRKALEVWPTLLIEALWPKRRILEVYLGIAEWGPGIYGIEAASHARFSKPSSRLTEREAALLAAVLPSPRTRDPSRATTGLQTRAGTIAVRAGQVPLGPDGEPCP
jgi:monofunctional glycosyltransferase